MKKRRCSQSNLDCYEARCPLEDQLFCDELDRWLYAGREAVSVNFERGGKPEQDAAHRTAVDKAGVYILFDDPEMIQDYWVNGGMNRQVCEMLKKGYLRWRTEKHCAALSL